MAAGWTAGLTCLLMFGSLRGAKNSSNANSPVRETAYVGAYEIEFPDWTLGLTNYSQYQWLISAYRTDYSVQLEFSQVNLEKNSNSSSCLKTISIYDGSAESDFPLISFCDSQERRLTTSSQTALIVFSSNSNFTEEKIFTLKYSAVKKRPNSETAHFFRLGFAISLGILSCVLVLACFVRHFKKRDTKPASDVVLFGLGRGGDRRQHRTSTREDIWSPSGAVLRDDNILRYFKVAVMRVSPVGLTNTSGTGQPTSTLSLPPTLTPAASSTSDLRLIPGEQFNNFRSTISNQPMGTKQAMSAFSRRDHVDGILPPHYEDCVPANTTQQPPHRKTFGTQAENPLRSISPPPPYCKTSEQT